jgi:hypothetical protein
VPRPVIPQLIAALVHADIGIYSVVATEPTLEEVYLGLQSAVADSGIHRLAEEETLT